MILPGGKYTLGQSLLSETFKMEPGSEAAQFFDKLRQFEIADINQEPGGKWNFKMLPNGWLLSGGLAAFFIIKKIRS